MKPAGTLAVRAVNQYRRRDVLAYLGLRYYLANSAARSDRWAREVATSLVVRRSTEGYCRVQHFKDVDSQGTIGHRDVFLPGANEALAEAALIDACAKSGGSFVPSDRVFSYLIATGDNTSGIFQHYTYGLRARHAAIANACKQAPNSRVLFLDIRRFYPSIGIAAARMAWHSACQESSLSKAYVEVGERILSDHGKTAGGRDGHLLTGPMFGHLVANLLLRNVDVRLASEPAQYFRYVDDIALVGDDAQIAASLNILQSELAKLQLELHGTDSSKTFTVGAADWLESEHDFAEERKTVSWMKLIGNVKRFLLWRPEQTSALHDALVEEGFRLPVPDYAEAVRERPYLDRVQSLLEFRWYQLLGRPASIERIVSQARALRHSTEFEVGALLAETEAADAFKMKRLLPKIRYRFGRLAYLSEPIALAQLARTAAEIPGLQFQSAVATSIATGSIDRILGFGTNAAQAVAQPLRMSRYGASLDQAPTSSAALAALAVFQLNGGAEHLPKVNSPTNELLRFAQDGVDISLMRSEDNFVQELSCLHGVASPRHGRVLDTAFDTSEMISLDAIEQANQSVSP